MRRKRKYKRSNKLSILCVSSILALSLMGVGYGIWNDTLNINANINTGYTGLEESIENLGKLKMSKKDNVIDIFGDVYWDTSEQISIMIRDIGTVPLVLNHSEKSIKEEENTKIAELDIKEKSNYGLFSTSIEDNLIEEFSLSISPPDEEPELLMMRTSNDSVEQVVEGESWYQNEINRLYNEINEIQDEIDRLNVIEEHHFNYELQFIQGI